MSAVLTDIDLLVARARVAAGTSWDGEDGGHGNRTESQELDVRNILRDCANALESTDAALKKTTEEYLAACKETYIYRSEAKAAMRETVAYAETLDAIREAFGQQSTRDVLDLVDAIEHCDGCRVKSVLARLQK